MTEPAYAGLPGLYACDPVELAARTFCRLFAGGSVVHPQRPLRTLDDDVARVAGLELHSGVLGTVSSAIWLQLQPYVLETVAIWTAARVAAVRASGGESSPSYLYLLRGGEQLLRSPDPYRTLLGWLPGETDLR